MKLALVATLITGTMFSQTTKQHIPLEIQNNNKNTTYNGWEIKRDWEHYTVYTTVCSYYKTENDDSKTQPICYDTGQISKYVDSTSGLNYDPSFCVIDAVNCMKEFVKLKSANDALQEDNKRLQILLDKLIYVKCSSAIQENNKMLDPKAARQSPATGSMAK